MTQPNVGRRLSPFSTKLFPVRGGSLGDRSRFADLEPLYRDFNGGYFWGRALLVRPMHPEIGLPLAMSPWNEDELWRGMYSDVCLGVLFFAEDAFGCQFGIRGGRVVQFDPETAEIVDMAESIDGWCEAILKDPDFYTGAPVLAAWEQQHQSIEVGYRLIPKQLFMLGGQFHSTNMVPKRDVEGLRARAQIWALTKDLPDGERLSFKID